MRVMDGTIRRGDSVKLMNTKKEVIVDEIGVLSPKPVPVRAAPPPLPRAPPGRQNSLRRSSTRLQCWRCFFQPAAASMRVQAGGCRAFTG